jgi:hypothetical protein
VLGGHGGQVRVVVRREFSQPFVRVVVQADIPGPGTNGETKRECHDTAKTVDCYTVVDPGVAEDDQQAVALLVDAGGAIFLKTKQVDKARMLLQRGAQLP